MPINKSEVVIGGMYTTAPNQERVVVGCNEECQVVYACRGGNVQSEFHHREASSLSRFAEACSEKIGRLSDEKLQETIEACNAQYALDGGNCCLQNS